VTKLLLSLSQPKELKADPIKLLETTIGLEVLVIPRKLSARRHADLFACIGRTINIDWLMTPGYLESTKVQSQSKHVEVQIEQYKHRGSTPLASTNLIEVGKFLSTIDRERLCDETGSS
jgi:hypothetical protein